VTYTKSLVGRFSPKNGCHVANGEILIVKPHRKVPIRNIHPHGFVGVDSRKKSKYGWVAESEQPFSLEEFLSRFGLRGASEEVDAIRLMLDSVKDLPAGVPVGCDYRKDGLSSRMNLWIHRVAFYPAPDNRHLTAV
jgi:hypothetical protein